MRILPCSKVTQSMHSWMWIWEKSHFSRIWPAFVTNWSTRPKSMIWIPRQSKQRVKRFKHSSTKSELCVTDTRVPSEYWWVSRESKTIPLRCFWHFFGRYFSFVRFWSQFVACFLSNNLLFSFLMWLLRLKFFPNGHHLIPTFVSRRDWMRCVEQKFFSLQLVDHYSIVDWSFCVDECNHSCLITRECNNFKDTIFLMLRSRTINFCSLCQENRVLRQQQMTNDIWRGCQLVVRVFLLSVNDYFKWLKFIYCKLIATQKRNAFIKM